MSGAEAHAAQQAPATFNAGEHILHHILDSNEIEVPFTQAVIHLPRIEIAGYDFSITRNVVMMWIAGVLLLAILGLAARRSKDPVPRGLRGLLEMLVLFVRDEIAHKNIPRHADRYVGYLLSTFFFILTCNLLGLVPGFSTPTSGISVTAGLAAMAFVMVQASGIREFGFLGHFRNLLPHGLPVWLIPIMLPVEFLGMFTKPFALCIRLFANMTAGHVVILSLISLIFIMKTAFMATVSVPFALFIYLLEILVAFLQAYIFTMLTSLFIGMAVHPAH
ncbi:MAG: F0F1 ATP synthase subunit A [Acidobacteriia bacterium]|nr:F0F1 ATP synthase subunit A [Terriglobia bacterium]